MDDDDDDDDYDDGNDGNDGDAGDEDDEDYGALLCPVVGLPPMTIQNHSSTNCG